MTLRARLIASFAIVAFLAFLPGALGVYATRLLQRSISELTGGVAPAIAELGRMRALAGELSSCLEKLSLAEDSPSDDAELDRSIEALQASLAVYLGHATNTPVIGSGAEEIGEIVSGIVKQADLFKGSSSPNSSTYVRGARQFSAMLAAYVDRALVHNAHELRFRNSSAANLLERFQNEQWKFGSIAVLLAVLLSFSLAASLSRPLCALAEAAERIGQGQRGIVLKMRSSREIQRLIESFNRMSSDLASTTVSKEFLDSILNSMQDALIVFDARLEVHSANKAAEEMLGCSTAMLAGWSIGRIFERVGGGVLAFASGYGGPQSSFEAVAVTASQQRVPVLLSAAPISIVGAPADGCVVVAKDITDIKRSEMELHLYMERLQHAEQLAQLGTMSAVLAHRLNQPLTSARLFIQQTVRSLTTAQAESADFAALHDSLEEIERASKAVKDVLCYTRKPWKNPARDIDVKAIADKTFRILAHRAEDIGVRLEIGKFDKLPLVSGVRDEIEELFFIICENAVEAASASQAAFLRLEAKLAPEQLCLEFIDNCGGMSDDVAKRVFEEFFTTKPPGRGTGLGLSIAQAIVKRHEGSIEVKSEEGVGTTFVLKLPLR